MDTVASVLAQAVEEILRAVYEDFQLTELDTQGACSYTALAIMTNGSVVLRKIIQARESKYALDLKLTDEATRVYGHLAPATKLLATMPFKYDAGQETFYFYELDLVPGVPYSSLIPRRASTDEDTIVQQRMLVGHLARFFARGWKRKSDKSYRQGKVGSQISVKLEKLSTQLPIQRLRTVAEWALGVMPLLDKLPVVLTHGDIVPSNIMVHPDSGMLRGMVDWVEAEYLPFGLAFYGLEYLLGFASKRRDSATDATVVSFVYYDCAPMLRLHFWTALLNKIPALKDNADLLKAVHAAKVIGTLLWFGFAWDNGAIDRVVTEERDGDMIAYLEAFLFAEYDTWDEFAGSMSYG